jgi:hypothetical protein
VEIGLDETGAQLDRTLKRHQSIFRRMARSSPVRYDPWFSHDVTLS